MPLYLTDEQRSMIAGALLAGAIDSADSLCCGDDAEHLATEIVGPEWEWPLRSWFTNECGCNFALDDFDAETRLTRPEVMTIEDYYLEKIAALEVLYTSAEIANGEPQLPTDWQEAPADVEMSGDVAADFLVQFIETEPDTK